jgi:hypothetical protein
VETFVLDTTDPMDMLQMSRRVAQIEQKYHRSLHGLVIVDTYQSREVAMTATQRMKQKKLRRKLACTPEHTEEGGQDAASSAAAGAGGGAGGGSGNCSKGLSGPDREELFHLNTHQRFGLQELHVAYQHLLQGPFRLLQARAPPVTATTLML